MTAQISRSDAMYALELVESICVEIGPGLPGTPQEKKRAEFIKEELAAHLGEDHVHAEEFSFSPGVSLYGPAISAVLMLIVAALIIATNYSSAPLRWVTSAAALILSSAIPLQFIFEFILGHEFIDFLYPKKVSQNIIGSLKRPGDAPIKRLLVLGGHHDSAPENAWMSLMGYGWFLFLSITYFFGLLSLFALGLIQFVNVLMSSASSPIIGLFGWIVLVFPVMPSILYALFINRGVKNGGTVPGAVDNLSSCATVISLCRFLQKYPSFIPVGTEIRFITFGSEEAGLRGSRRYVQRHLEELRSLDTRMLNFEMIVSPVISILTSDINGTVKNSLKMVQSAVEAAQRSGVPYKILNASLGMITDAAPFNQAGLKAVPLLPVDMQHQFASFYHQKRDTPDQLSIEPLENALKLALEWIRHNGE